MSTVMQPTDTAHPLLRRLEVAFNPHTRSLERGGRQRHLAPREADVLEVLLKADDDEVIRRSELLDQVWGEGDVCEDALTVIISRLRRHFTRLGIQEPVIETVPRRGYRLGACMRGRAHYEARRDGRRARMLGLLALGLSALALAFSSMSLWIALR